MSGGVLDLSRHPVGLLSLAIFAVAYLAVMAEEFTHLRKSKPVLLAAGLIWVMIAWVGAAHGLSDAVNAAVRHNILEFSELFLFLLLVRKKLDTPGVRVGIGGYWIPLRTLTGP